MENKLSHTETGGVMGYVARHELSNRLPFSYDLEVKGVSRIEELMPPTQKDDQEKGSQRLRYVIVTTKYRILSDGRCEIM